MARSFLYISKIIAVLYGCGDASRFLVERLHGVWAESESPDRGMSGALTAARLERRKASGKDNGAGRGSIYATMEAFHLLSRGGVNFDKQRFKSEVKLFRVRLAQPTVDLFPSNLAGNF